MLETQLSASETDLKLMRSLAREVALDIYPLETILKQHSIDANQWEKITKQSYFNDRLLEEMRHWSGTPGTAERVKLKFLVMLEDSSEEMWARLHDKKEPLSSKVELWKTLMRGAGVGVQSVDGSTAGERISIQINMGSDTQLKVEKAPRVIDQEGFSL